MVHQQDYPPAFASELRPYFISSPLASYCLRLPTGGSVSVMRTTAVRDILRSTAASKASMWWGRKRWQRSTVEEVCVTHKRCHRLQSAFGNAKH